ncbi:MAG: hypothetical protein PHN99_01855 [Eubacteriales bacterium]|nr:hypothetical protein [Eubacteriales bacterium]MDD4716836.1 hypothetical protein [Eubacteriales bacterium]
MYISFEDLVLFILICLAVVVGIFLIIALKHLIGLLKKLNRIVDTNKDDIDRTVQALPKTVSSIGDVADSLKDTSDKAGQVIGTIDGAVTTTVETVNDTSDNVYEIIKVAGLIAKFISDAFRKDDDDR